MELAEYLVNELHTYFQKPLHSTLTDREFQVFSAIANGKGLTEIANQLTLSVKTISTYRSRLLKKMQLTKNADIINYALENNLHL